MKRIGVGIVGAGERGVYVFGTRVEELTEETGLYVAAIHDTNPARAAEARDYLARCSVCDRVCPYRVLSSETVSEIGIAHRMDKDYQTVSDDRWAQRSWLEPATPNDVTDARVFSPESDIWDYTVSTVTFASGAVATLFFSIFGPAADDQETLELVHEIARLPSGSPPPVGVRDGLEALRLVEATRRSAKEGGRPVDMREIPRDE